MTNKTYTYNHSRKELVEKADRKAPDMRNYDDFAQLNHDKIEYGRYIGALKKYPCNWLSESDNGRELVEDKDFWLQYWRNGVGGRREVSKLIYKASPSDLRGEVIAIPIQSAPVETKITINDLNISFPDTSAKEFADQLYNELCNFHDNFSTHAMSDHTIYLQGQKKMLSDIIDYLVKIKP